MPSPKGICNRLPLIKCLIIDLSNIAFNLPSEVKCLKFEKIFGGRGIQTSHRKHTRLIIILISIHKILMRIKSNMVEAEISESKLNLVWQDRDVYLSLKMQ